MLVETHKAQLTSEHQTALEMLRIEASEQIEKVKHAHQVEMEQYRTALQIEVASDDRIRAEIVKWANPILGAVNALQARLSNILEHDAYVALHRGFHRDGWSMTYEYFIRSTLYAFAEYFCWVRMLEERMSFELFRNQDQKNVVFSAFTKVAEALRSFPPPFECSGKDAQLFMFQQRAIGEMMMRDVEGRPACMPFHEFELKLGESKFNRHLEPLRSLLDGLSPTADCRWVRLQLTYQKLQDLSVVCRDLLQL